MMQESRAPPAGNHELTLRLVAPEGTTTVRVERAATVAAFVARVLAGREGRVMAGFPPRQLLPDDQSAIGDLVRDSETLRVVLAEEPEQRAGRRRGGDPVAASVARAKKRQSAAGRSAAQAGISHRNDRAVERSISRARQAAGMATPRRRRAAPLTSEEESAAALAQAAAGASDTRSRGLRRVFRRAVEGQYEEVRAVSRVGALRGGYTVTPLDQRRVRVEFAEVDTHRGRRHSEEVELYDQSTLAAVLRVVLADPEGPGLESLKPINLARASPRVFWSLAVVFGSDLRAGLQQLLPEVRDWAFLNERKRSLSEKAEANLEQQRAAAERAAKRSKGSKPSADVVGPAVAGEAEAAEGVREEEISEAQLRVRELLSAPCDDLVPGEWRSALGFECRLGPLAQALDALTGEEQVRAFVEEVSRRRGGPALSFDELDSWVAAAQATVVRNFCEMSHTVTI